MVFVQTANAGTPSGTATTKAATYGSAQSASNCNIVTISFGVGSGTVVTQSVVSVKDTSNNTYVPITSFRTCVGAGGTGAVGQIIYLCNNIKAAGAGINVVTVTLNGAASFFAVTIEEFGSIAFATPDVKIENSQSSPSAVTATSGPLTIGTTENLIGSFCFFDGPAGSLAAGFTQRASYYTALCCDQLGATAGTYTLTANSTGTSGWVVQMVALKAGTAPLYNNWFVRSGGAGAGTGVDWNNAWDISTITWASVSPGDTVWLAGGSYTAGTAQLLITASGISGSPINIYRATVSDPAATSAAGWSSAFDSTVSINSGNYPLIKNDTSNYITIDGRTSNGIVLTGPATGGPLVLVGSTGASLTNLTFSHLQLISSTATTGIVAGRYGFDLVPGQFGAGTLSNSLVQYCNIGPGNEAFRANNWTNVTVQYCTVHDMTLDNFDHNDFCYFAGTFSNVIWRYNIHYNSPSDGMLFESNSPVSSFYLYGNVFYNCIFAILHTKAGTGNQTLYIYNNTFAGQDPNVNYAFITLLGTSLGCQIYDNIWYNAQNQASGNSGVTSDYNAYYPSPINGQTQPPAGETHSLLLNSVPFNNAAGGDFRLSAAGVAASPGLANGLALTTDGFINFDMNGVQRGSPWYMGAYQYVSGSGGGGARIVPSLIGAYNFWGGGGS